MRRVGPCLTLGFSLCAAALCLALPAQRNIRGSVCLCALSQRTVAGFLQCGWVAVGGGCGCRVQKSCASEGTCRGAVAVKLRDVQCKLSTHTQVCCRVSQIGSRPLLGERGCGSQAGRRMICKKIPCSGSGQHHCCKLAIRGLS